MWWSHIERAVPNESHLTQGHKNIIKRTKPGYVVTGPKMAVEFYEVTKVDIQTGEQKTADTLIMKENRAGMGYPDSYYIINDYDLKTVIEWWEENWKFLLKGPDEDEPGDKYHLNPPDPADMWKHEKDDVPYHELVQQLRKAIENLEPAGDVREIYRDAIDAGVDSLMLDTMLDHYVKSDHLSPEEVDMIKEPPPGPDEWAQHLS
jgi:hypothetical protein